jgi:hypothetical protein
VLLLDSEGKERARREGYLPNNDFVAALRNGLGRIAFVHRNYADAERWYGDVVTRFGDSHFAPEAMYWRAVSHYKATNDHTVLGEVPRSFEPPTRPVCGRAKQFHGCIRNEAKSSPKSDLVRIKSVNRVFALTLTFKLACSSWLRRCSGPDDKAHLRPYPRY